MRSFDKSITNNCFDYLHVIVAKLNEFAKSKFFVRTGRRYERKLNLESYVAAQKQFQSKKNLSAKLNEFEIGKFRHRRTGHFEFLPMNPLSQCVQ